MAAASCLLASVSEQLTPAIAVLFESFTSEDFEIDCDGCTACCCGHHGVKLDEDELSHYPAVNIYPDPRGEWRMKQIAGQCVYLSMGDNERWGCSIHGEAMPRRCREFDCRAAVITYSPIGIDELVAKGELPLAVVEMGRLKLDEWNRAMEVRALSGGGDLSFLMEDDNGEVSQEASSD